MIKGVTAIIKAVDNLMPHNCETINCVNRAFYDHKYCRRCFMWNRQKGYVMFKKIYK